MLSTAPQEVKPRQSSGDIRRPSSALGRADGGVTIPPQFAISLLKSAIRSFGSSQAVASAAGAPDRSVILWTRSPGLNITEDWFSTAQYFDIKTRHRGFEQLAIAIGANAKLTGDSEPERVGTIRASSILLPMLGAGALHGQLFRPQQALVGTRSRTRRVRAPTAFLAAGTTAGPRA